MVLMQMIVLHATHIPKMKRRRMEGWSKRTGEWTTRKKLKSNDDRRRRRSVKED